MKINKIMKVKLLITLIGLLFTSLITYSIESVDQPKLIKNKSNNSNDIAFENGNSQMVSKF